MCLPIQPSLSGNWPAISMPTAHVVTAKNFLAHSHQCSHFFENSFENISSHTISPPQPSYTLESDHPQTPNRDISILIDLSSRAIFRRFERFSQHINCSINERLVWSFVRSRNHSGAYKRPKDQHHQIGGGLLLDSIVHPSSAGTKGTIPYRR